MQIWIGAGLAALYFYEIKQTKKVAELAKDALRSATQGDCVQRTIVQAAEYSALISVKERHEILATINLTGATISVGLWLSDVVTALFR